MAANRRIRLSRKAREDIREIWQFTAARWSAKQADGYVTSLDRVFGLIADHPELGVLRREIRPPIRMHRHQAHVIAYRAVPDGIEVIRVLHLRRDWLALLDE